MEVYVYKLVKHFDRECPCIVSISDEILAHHKNDDVATVQVAIY